MRLALIGPLVDVPPGLEIPGGVVIPPGSIVPPGWQPGDPYPDGWIPAPPPPPDTGPTSPIYNDPLVPGPTPPPGGGPAPAAGIPGSGTYTSAESADDGCWGSNTYFSSVAASMWFGFYTPSQHSNIFIRFRSVDIPREAEITSAVLTLRCSETKSGSAGGSYVQAEDADDAFPPTSYATAEALALTSELVNWNPGGWTKDSYYDSPDLSDVIQEVVDRSGWGPGNDLMLVIRGSGAAIDYNNCYTINLSVPADNPYLSVEWIA